MILPLDAINRYGLHEFHLKLSSSARSNDDRLRHAISDIVTPLSRGGSPFKDNVVALNTARVLAACHDPRPYVSSVNDYIESRVVYGLRRHTFEGLHLGDWEFLRSVPDALQCAQSLVAVTNVAWMVSGVDRKRTHAGMFGTADHEQWLESEGLIRLARQHAHNIDPVLRVIDERRELDAEEIERILDGGVLHEGVL